MLLVSRFGECDEDKDIYKFTVKAAFIIPYLYHYLVPSCVFRGGLETAGRTKAPVFENGVVHDEAVVDMVSIKIPCLYGDGDGVACSIGSEICRDAEDDLRWPIASGFSQTGRA